MTDTPDSTTWPSPFDVPDGTRVRRRRRTRPGVAAVLVAGTIGASALAGHDLWPAAAEGASAAASSSSPTNHAQAAPASPSSSAPASQASTPADQAAITAKVNPALVDIVTTMKYQQAQGAGTGIVLTSNGEILTNNHVINGATSIRVTDIGNGQTYRATVVGYDRSDDVAVLQLTGASGLTTATMGDSSQVKLGDAVMALGNAGGVGGTPSAAAGSITALNQAITASDELDGTSENLTDLMQTDANVQAGDSGGPLVDRQGRVIGLDTAASTGYSLSSVVNTNQGYAIPINRAVSIASQIESGQSSSAVHIGSTAFLGVLISSGHSPYSNFGSSSRGVPVSNVVSGGTADEAGITAGSVITSVDGQVVSSPTGLTALMSSERPGQPIQLAWTDSSGTPHTATVVLQAGPPA
jgi:S1-C subfamily serine protease